MSSLIDIFTAAKNIVVALNQLGEIFNASLGVKRTNSLSAASTTVVASKPGRLVRIIVTTAGSTTGSVYDMNNSSTRPVFLIYTIPNVIGVYDINVPLTTGLVVTTGTGQTAIAVYS